MFQFSMKDVVINKISTLYQRFFKLDEYQVQHALHQGGTSPILTREMFDRGDAVVLMLYDKVRDSLIMLEQFRPGALNRDYSPWLLEFVAGMYDEQESAVDVAIREAKEEANIDLNADDIRPVCRYLSSPGGMNEQIDLLLGLVDSSQAQGVFGLPEEGEDILLHVVEREQAMALLAQGKITNAATIIGLQWLQLNYQGL